MCFSATASFIASAALITTGIYTSRLAYKKNKYYLPLSTIPLFFGIQQCMEGIIWTDYTTGNFTGAHNAALVYLFFAFAWWPFYLPFSIYLIEEKKKRKKIILGLMGLGLLIGFGFYLTVLLRQPGFEVSTLQHTIVYHTHESNTTMLLYTLVYIFIVLTPLMLCSHKLIKVLGSLLLISVIISFIGYAYAFCSVWCFFAALISLYICYIAKRIST